MTVAVALCGFLVGAVLGCLGAAASFSRLRAFRWAADVDADRARIAQKLAQGYRPDTMAP